MWRLEREDGGGQPIRFLSGTEHLVGRKNCSILIEDDQSISRAHAMLMVSHPPSSLGQPDKIPVLSVKDSSKYGTFINGDKMESGSSRNVKSGDKITFGVYNSKFRVIYEPIVACSSCLNVSEKAALNQALQLLGGHVVNNWTEKCTHLVMSSVKVTIKTVCALICCKSIVKPEYFSEIIKAIQKKQSLPALASFVPILDEPSLQMDSLDLSENEKRKSIFRDKFFIFLTAKQYKKLSPAVHFGGGKAKLVTGESDEQSLLEKPNICVIDIGTTESQLSESQTQSFITHAMSTLQRKGLRAIPESEIGLAVIYMSTETYCNPQQHAGNRNETEKAAKSYIVESSLSSSIAVNETVLPATTFNTTAYVANTEPQDQTTNWMDISGVREVKETPKSGPRSNSTKPMKAMDHDVESSIAGDCRAALFPESPRPAEKKSQPVPSRDKPTSQKGQTSQKAGSSNKIENYFQTVAKKRDREDNESELSTAKLARVEAHDSECADLFKDIFLTKRKDKVKPSPKDVGFSLDTEPDVVSKSDFSNIWPNGNIKASMASAEKDSSVKRKQPDDEVVEESDLENDGEIGDQMDQDSPKENPVMAKKRRVDSTGVFEKGFKIEPQEEGGDRTKESPPQQSDWKIKTHPIIKQEPQSPHEDRKTAQMLVRPKEENDDSLPNRLLLSEFRSLIVSRPSRDGQHTATTNHKNGPNFKKFRKVAFPGAGSFPHIIGGSDLIAHDKQKNSELEQWLRQEMEEQTRQAREQSLAEDLFRYNPKTLKKRR